MDEMTVLVIDTATDVVVTGVGTVTVSYTHLTLPTM